ncbi:hypothetical protein HMPREF2719_00310 [Pseudomonas aeruginosa]|jgi:hypothetical protein|nr:hypothetical protein AN280_27770 [Pseudomonas aeruginosa]OHP42812.1 hypothetical protein HMPREF2719_00310 [Pseudomonas aeruginosa]ORE33467.1 hypothetical protein BKN47_17810 [Pseudomonas aeruginosa]RPS34280.1 hypothetical protein IPC1008_30370 [Pseudomonas aeruginosa]GLF18936.1 hypothetical protein VNPA131289_56270 [Pseudomonas aeruginosa]
MAKDAVSYPRAVAVLIDRSCNQDVFFRHIAILVDRMKQVDHLDHELFSMWLERSRDGWTQACEVQAAI